MSKPPNGSYPIHLTREEQQQPHRVLQEFFTSYHLPEVRRELRDWFAYALSTESDNLQCARDRSNLFYLYLQMEKLAEAAWVLHRRHHHRKVDY